MRFIFRKYFIVFAALCLSFSSTYAQNFANGGPQPGDKYKEFYLSMGIGSALSGNEWRVTDPNVNTVAYPAAAAFLPNPILEISLDDLTGATRAEFVLDIWEGHPGTTDKEFRVNGNDWIPVPELVTTPSNPSYYMSQRNAIVEVPLLDLVSGSINTIEGNSGPQAGPYNFGWGQWGWYGIVVRVYYGTTSTDYAGTVSINGSGSGTSFGDNPTVLFTPNLVSNPERVDFIAYYEGYDIDGDGFYKDWQREYHRDNDQADIVIDNIVGKATSSPYSLTWNTDWVPDQEQNSIKLIARVKGTDGFWYVTDKIENLTLTRDVISVKLFKPSGVPERYWVRGSSIGSSKSHTINIPTNYNLSIASSALMLTSTWNGRDKGSLTNSALFNGNGLADHGLYNYYKYDEVNVPVGYLKLGDNTITYQSDESEEHGIEVNWPGSGLYVKFDYSLIPPVIATVNGQFVILKNNGTTYEVKLQLNTDTGTDDFGSGNLVVNFNDFDLGFPSSPEVNTDYFWSTEVLNNGNYSSSANNVTKPLDNQFRVNFEMTSDNNGLVLAASPAWTDIITIKFNIIDVGGNAGLDWQNGVAGSGFNLFDGSNDFPLTLGTFTDLNTSPLPVELTNFTAANTDADVNLNWETATEVDNYGFEVERALNNDEKVWENIGFVTGYGNSNSPKEYSYVDNSPIGGNKFVYRLKQIDNDGTYTYSDAVEVEVIPNRYELYQNYPNPFNPSTTIRFSLGETQDVKIVIFDQLGQEVRTIVNQKFDAGYQEFEINASGIASGVYFYRIITGDFVNVKKMMLLK